MTAKKQSADEDDKMTVKAKTHLSKEVPPLDDTYSGLLSQSKEEPVKTPPSYGVSTSPSIPASSEGTITGIPYETEIELALPSSESVLVDEDKKTSQGTSTKRGAADSIIPVSSEAALRSVMNGIWKVIGLNPKGLTGDEETQIMQLISEYCGERIKTARHEQRHQALGVSRWISVGEEHGYWNHPMTVKKCERVARNIDGVVKLALAARINELNFVLQHASGGGSWRRVVISRIAKLESELQSAVEEGKKDE